jgi:hypothetical protein
MRDDCRFLTAACPRNQEDPTAVLRDESGVIVLDECQDGGQGAGQDDVGLAAFRALCNLNRCCQSNSNQSPNIKILRISRCQLTPFGHGGGSVLLECFAWGEMTFEIEMIVDRSMN